MVEWHTKSKRRATGGLRKSVNARDKKLSERGGIIASTRVTESDQEAKNKKIRTRGKNIKNKALRAKNANITDQKTKKTEKWEITSVKQNQANKLFVRRNIITRNAIIEVKNKSQARLARVTSRPGQSGSVEAILLTPEEAQTFEEEKTKKKTKKIPKELKKPAKEAVKTETKEEKTPLTEKKEEKKQ